MNADKLTKWGTLAANVGVLIGLALVLAELNQNRTVMRAQIRHELSASIVDMLHTEAAYPQLADILRRAEDGEMLTPTEQLQFNRRTNALLRYWEDVHYQYRLGLYDRSEFEAHRRVWAVSFASTQQVRSYWCAVREWYSPEFSAEMDRALGDKPC